MLWLVYIVSVCVALNQVTNACDCGLENLSSRVFRGNATTKNRYPWLVKLEARNSMGSYSSCGGALISNQHVVTAAHCVIKNNTPRKAEDVTAYLGAHSLSQKSSQTVAKVQSFQYYNDYMDDNRGRDIALITLTKPVKFTQTIQPICILRKPITSDVKLKVVGWGVREPGSSRISNTPFEAEIDFIPNSKCNKLKEDFYLEKNYISYRSQARQFSNFRELPEDICAVNLRTRADACPGDSGGPLMYQDPNNGRWYLAGVVSRGWDDCGVSDIMPGIYTGVYSHLKSLFTKACS